MFMSITEWSRRYLGEVIIGGASFHSIMGLCSTEGSFANLVRNGWFGSMNPGYTAASGETFWFTFTGLALLGTGFLVRSHLHATGTLPASFGWTLTIVGVLTSTAMPASGGWLILASGLLALAINRPAIAEASSPSPVVSPSQSPLPPVRNSG